MHEADGEMASGWKQLLLPAREQYEYKAELQMRNPNILQLFFLVFYEWSHKKIQLDIKMNFFCIVKFTSLLRKFTSRIISAFPCHEQP